MKNSIHIYQQTPVWKLLLILSLIPIAVKLLSLLLMGSYIAASVCMAVLVPLIYGLFWNTKRLSGVLRYWAFMLIGYGLLRSLMHLLVLSVGNGVESSIWYQFGIVFHLKNIMLMAMGFWLSYLVRVSQTEDQK